MGLACAQAHKWQGSADQRGNLMEMKHDEQPIDPGVARRLWQEVVLKALQDTQLPRRDRDGRAAREWIEQGGKRFEGVCEMAGIDPDFLRDSYLSGRIDFSKILHGKFGTGKAHGK